MTTGTRVLPPERGKQTVTEPLPAAMYAPQLTTRRDVRRWFGAILDAGFNWHPEDGFAAFALLGAEEGAAEPEGGWPLSNDEAVRLNSLLRRATTILGDEDPCALALEVLRERGMV